MFYGLKTESWGDGKRPKMKKMCINSKVESAVKNAVRAAGGTGVHHLWEGKAVLSGYRAREQAQENGGGGWNSHFQRHGGGAGEIVYGEGL